MRLLATIKFGEYMPDQPDLENPGMEVARDCLPRLNGYDALPTLQSLGFSGLPSRPVGAYGAADSIGSKYLLAGTADKLWRLADGAWRDISRTSPEYAQVSAWEFTEWDADVLAASAGNRMQRYPLGAANAEDLTEEPVAGAHIAVVRSQVVVGGVIDEDGSNPQRLRWSGVNAYTDWAPNADTLAGFGDIRTPGGDIQRVSGGEFGVVLLERSIYRMTFVGGDLVWQLDEVDPGIGTPAPGSVIRRGDRVFFLGNDGMRMTQGAASTAIGEERVDLEVLSDLDVAHVTRITAGVYTAEQIIVWAYPGAGNTNGQPNRLLIYNYGTDRWALGDEAVEILVGAATPNRSIDGFDDNVTFGGTQSPPLYDSIDEIPGSLDDPIWGGGEPQLMALDAAGDVGTYTGSARNGTFETGEFEVSPGRRTFLTEMRNLSNAPGSVALEIGHRQSQSDPVVWTGPASPNADGIIPVRVNDRYMRIRVQLDSGFSHSNGVQLFGEVAGGR